MSQITLLQGDCLEKLKELPDGSIDLTITSPPYDNLRTYNGNISQWGERVWKTTINSLYRVTKQGGIVVWIVGDATIKGSETGTSFKQALYFKEIGFNLHDTMIYAKDGFSFPDAHRYYACFEYMFIFSKGKPKTIYQIADRKNKHAGSTISGVNRNSDGSTRKMSCSGNKIKEFGVRGNIWTITPQKTNRIHPAMFPEKIAKDHIISWSNTKDTVLDPFMGSGTTGIACKNLNRNFIGIELDETYFNIAKSRISNYIIQSDFDI